MSQLWTSLILGTEIIAALKYMALLAVACTICLLIGIVIGVILKTKVDKTCLSEEEEDARLNKLVRR